MPQHSAPRVSLAVVAATVFGSLRLGFAYRPAHASLELRVQPSGAFARATEATASGAVAAERNVNVESCLSTGACPVVVKLHIAANASLDKFSDMEFSAKLLDWAVESLDDEVQAAINDKREALQPHLDAAVATGEKHTRGLVKKEIASFQHFLATQVEDLADTWWNSLMNGDFGLVSSMVATLSNRSAHLVAEIHPRTEAAAHSEDFGTGWSSICDKLLRLRLPDNGSASGEVHLIQDWENILLARTFDPTTQCSQVYSAHCVSAELTKITDCPFTEPDVEKMSLSGLLFHLSQHRTIEVSENMLTRLFTPDEIAVNTDVYVDLVSASEGDGANIRTGLGISSAPAGHLGAVVKMVDDKFPGVLLDEVCVKAAEGALLGMAFKRCRDAIRSLLSAPQRFEAGFSIGSAKLAVVMELGIDGLFVHVAPDWAAVSRVADAAILSQLQQMSDLPLSMLVEEGANLSLSGNGAVLSAELWPVFTGVVNISQLAARRA